MKREVRTFSGVQLRAKKSDDGKPGATGYAAVFNQVTDLGYFREQILPGAFKRALSEKQDVRCLMNHDANIVLGRTKNETLSLAEDKTGLQFEDEFPETQAATDLHKLLDRGDVDQCSFGFIVRKQTWTEEESDGVLIQTRSIEDVDLLDVSIVTYPAYEGTSCEARGKFLFPDGMPPEVREHVKDEEMCDCACASCRSGDCSQCSDDECEDPHCAGHEDRSARDKKKKKTKRVDGVDLTADCFAYVGDPDKTATWKLPIKFPGDEDKTKSHIRNALARFNQTKGIPADKKDAVWNKIVAAAKKYGIKVSEEDSKKWHLTDAQYRGTRVDPDDDGDDDSEIVSAIDTAGEACEDCGELLEAAAEEYDSESLEAALTECKKTIAVLEKAAEALQKELDEDKEEGDDAERMKLRLRALAASL
jgi:Escherichia/Staphylococcus phage prohead protease